MAKRKPLTIGAAPTTATQRLLLVALAPMVADVRASIGHVKTAADAKAFGVALRKRWTDAKIAGLVAAVGAKVERAGSLPWRRVVDARAKTDRMDAKKIPKAKQYDGAKLVDGWTRNAAKLITSVRDEVAEGLRRDVVAALEAGTSPAELAARWVAQGVPVEFGTLEGRMRVIAQHQVASLNAEVQRARAGSVGVSEFVWHHSGQPSPPARAEHVARDGRRFAYDDPPADGLVGTLPNCRCWAESVIPDELAEALGLSALFER
jgi:hypothetical protein